MRRFKWFPLVAGFTAIVFCFVLSPSAMTSDGPFQRLRQAAQDKRDLVQASNEDAQQARRDNIERIRNSGPSCRGGSCPQFRVSSGSSSVLLLRSSSQPSVLLLRSSH